MTNINYTLLLKDADTSLGGDGFTIHFYNQIQTIISDKIKPYYLTYSDEDEKLINDYAIVIANAFNSVWGYEYGQWYYESLNFMDYATYKLNPWYGEINDVDGYGELSYEKAAGQFIDSLVITEFTKWVSENQLIIFTNIKTLQLSNSDTYKTERTYTINKNDNSNSTYKEGFNGGGLQNQQGTKLSNSSTTTNTQTGTDTDKYNQTDTLRQLNYLQQLKPLDYTSLINNIKNRLLVTIWSD